MMERQSSLNGGGSTACGSDTASSGSASLVDSTEGCPGRVAAVVEAAATQETEAARTELRKDIARLDEHISFLKAQGGTAARAVAESLGAEKLVLLSDVSGVCRDKADPTSLISTLSPEEADALIASGIIDEGMIPKVQACLETLRAGVAKAHIIDGRLRHSLLLEVYTNQGVGTQILRDSA